MTKKINLVIIVPIILLILFYFVTRLYHLTIVPVFCDEAIYIRWAQVMRAVQSLRFLPLSDGKQPLFMWLVIPFLKIFANPLVAGRMVSVTAGLGTMAGIGILGYLLFKKKEVAFFASLLYLLSPFCLFFDRMALADGLLSMFGVWCLIFFILLVRTTRLDVSMISGILLGLGLMTKSPALFFALMLPLNLLVKNGCHCEGFCPEAISKKPFRKKIASLSLAMTKTFPVLKLFGLWLIIYLFGFTIYNILRLGPEFHMIAIRNKDYIYSFSEVLSHPFNPLIGHLKDVLGWYWILLTPPVFILGLLGIFVSVKKNFRVGVLLLLWFLLPILAQSAVAKVFTARYVLFTVPVFLIFSAYSLSLFYRSLFYRSDLLTGRTCLSIVAALGIFLFPLSQIFFLLVNPQRVRLPKEERNGYLEMWTAGYGIMEAADYIKEVSKTQKVLVGTEGYFGTLPDGLQIYLEGVPNITIIGVGQPVVEISPKLIDGLKDNRVFMLVNDSRFKIVQDSRLKLINSYPKATSSQNTQENLLLFDINK